MTEVSSKAEPRLQPMVVFLSFAAFGVLWGLYAAALPAIKQRAGASDSELGLALVAVGAAAAPAMLLVGRLLDRWGRPVAIGAVVLFAVMAPLPTLANSVTELVGALLLFGFASGACDVVINSLAANVEGESDIRIMNRAAAVFSAGLLVGSLGTGAVRAFGLEPWTLLVGIGVAVVVGSIALRHRVPQRLVSASSSFKRPARLSRLVVGLGLLAALAAVVESGVQQWSAVFLEEAVNAPAGLSGAAPGVFAGSMALGRLAAHGLSKRISDRQLLLLSGGISCVGVLTIAVSSNALVALVGFAVAGGAISVAGPAVYGVVGRRADPQNRSATIGHTATIAYIGLLLGPVLVGQLASATNLRTAIGSLAVVSVAVCVAALLVPRSNNKTVRQ
ncbi:MFS transporter [Polymorphospora rubra]|uniref:MFS transporter n=1 Tax=Polymorphospora rubra TaxID=338584 RepID=UPI00340EA1C2